jgi:hypothetical protein
LATEEETANRDESELDPQAELRRRKRKAELLHITPLHRLGDKHILSKLVTETIAGMATIEESNQLKDEINQLQVSPAPLFCFTWFHVLPIP